MDLGGFLTELRTTDTYKYLGKIEKIVGMTIETAVQYRRCVPYLHKGYEVAYPCRSGGIQRA